MRIAIVGSRTYPDERAVREFVRSLPEGTIIVSGGAAGVDTWAAKAARKRGLKVVEHRADWEALGDVAGPIRNTAIVEDSDEIVAFWDGVSTGTNGHRSQGARGGQALSNR